MLVVIVLTCQHYMKKQLYEETIMTDVLTSYKETIYSNNGVIGVSTSYKEMMYNNNDVIDVSKSNRGHCTFNVDNLVFNLIQIKQDGTSKIRVVNKFSVQYFMGGKVVPTFKKEVLAKDEDDGCLANHKVFYK